MKKINWFIFTFMAFAIFACDDEEVLDSEAPTINITSPTNGEDYTLGEADLDINIAFTVMDDMGLEEVTLSVMRPDGTTTELETWDVNDFLNDNREVSEEFTLTLPNNTPAGDYTIMVDASDESANTATQESVTITIIEGSTGGEAGITVGGIEEGATIESVGNRTPFSFDVRDTEGVDSLNVNVMTENGTEISNQNFGADFFSTVGDNTNFTVDTALNIPNVAAARGNQTLTVNAFRGGQMVQTSEVNFVGEPMAGAREVTFTVSVPATVPDTAQVVIAGNFQSPAPFRTDNPLYALTKNEDGTWSGTFFVSEDMAYKYALLSEESNDETNYRFVEKDLNCAEISDRTYTFEGGEATVTDTVENFRNLAPCGD
jgi:cytochrome c-type biogenesis protein CcmE